MRRYRPEGLRGAGDGHLFRLCKALQKLLSDTQCSFRDGTLRLRKPETTILAEILVEFAEDVHNGIGLWEAYERYNRELFGVALPFARSDEPAKGVTLAKVQHLLWIVSPELRPGLVASPHHGDLARLAEAAHAFLVDAFHSVPRGSGIRAFLESPNEWGWEIKRKLIWLGTCSYMFRLHFGDYLAEHNRGRWNVSTVDDFLCQECTRWSGLGAIDILAGVLAISDEDRKQLRGWHERHASFYRLDGVSDSHLDATNVVSRQPYRIRIDMPNHPFKQEQLVFGSVVPWRGVWYWSGEQEMWDRTAPINEGELRETMKRQSSQIVCRFWDEYRAQVLQRAASLHAASLAYHGTDLVIYPDGLTMAADWQKELRAAWESQPRDQIEQAIRKHGLKRGKAEMEIPADLREHDGGIGVFLSPVEGREIMTGFDTLVAGLRRRGHEVTREEEDAIQGFIESDSISPAFVRRVVAEHGSESVRTAFRLPEPVPEYWLEYLLRRHKGHFYRRRYPAVAVV